jgi:hypothetical protein
MGMSFTVTQPHELGRMEAKRRIDRGINETLEKWGLIDTWTDNVATLTGSGKSSGVTGTATVRNHGVDVTINVPDDKLHLASLYESETKAWLTSVLAKS